MKVIDARRDLTIPLFRRMRGVFRGAVDRALASATPAATWTRELRTLRAAARRWTRACLLDEMRRRGRDPGADWLDALGAARDEGEAVAAANMSPGRAAKLLGALGIDLDRAMRLVELVGPAVADAVAWLDVVDLVALRSETRGAA